MVRALVSGPRERAVDDSDGILLVTGRAIHVVRRPRTALVRIMKEAPSNCEDVVATSGTFGALSFARRGFWLP